MQYVDDDGDVLYDMAAIFGVPRTTAAVNMTKHDANDDDDDAQMVLMMMRMW